MKKHSHPTSWPIILGIALLATGTQTVKAAQPEPTQQAAPSTDPSADIKELETLHLPSNLGWLQSMTEALPMKQPHGYTQTASNGPDSSRPCVEPNYPRNSKNENSTSSIVPASCSCNILHNSQLRQP